jgi:DeoR/GlpR family transcriptional regulator of sugar metabolism
MTHPSLLLQERHSLILLQLDAHGRVLAPDLARQMNVSEDTVRRDLRDLAAAGYCQKVYGGAVRSPSPMDSSTLAQRLTRQTDSKSRLATTAAGLVAPGCIVFIDAGSSNLSIAKALPRMPLTVITNAPLIAAALAERTDMELILVGGRVDPRSGAILGAGALREAELTRPDLFIMGACTVDAQAGIGAFHFDEACFKRSVAAISKATLVAATRDKLGTAAPYHVLDAARLTYLVLPADADTDAATGTGTGTGVSHAAAFSELGVHVLHAV